MSHALHSSWTLNDFLVWEASHPDRYEFIDGVVRMMVGGTLAHNTIALNLATALRAGLRPSSCRVFTSDVKVVSAQSGEVAYPDVIVACQPILPAEDRITEPKLIAEVLSRSTADYDRGAKFEMYKTITSLQYYLVIAQDRRQVDLYQRTITGWELTRMEGVGAIALVELGCTVSLETIYEDAGC